MQLPQSNFVLCSYQPKDTHPKEVIILEGCTVDYLAESKENNISLHIMFLCHQCTQQTLYVSDIGLTSNI